MLYRRVVLIGHLLALLVLITNPTQPARMTLAPSLPVISPQNISNLTRIACLKIPDGDGHANMDATQWSPDGTVLTANGMTGLWVFSVDSSTATINKSPRLLPGQTQTVIGFSPDSNYLYNVLYDDSILQWDLRIDQQQSFLDKDRLRSFRILNKPATIIASWHSEEATHIWDIAKGKESGVLPNGGWPMAFSSDGSQLAVSGAPDDPIRLYDVNTLRVVAELKHPDLLYIRALAFSPNGKTLAVADDYAVGTVWLWNMVTKQPQSSLKADYYDGILRLVFSSDSKRLISWGRTAVYLWNVETGTQIAALAGHGFDDVGAIFSPDGNLIASWDDHRRTRFWDGQTGRELRTIEYIWNATFSPDGKLLAIYGNTSGTVELWGIAPPYTTLDC